MVMILPASNRASPTATGRPAGSGRVNVQRAMENINGAYGRIAAKDTAVLPALSNSIGPAGSSFNNLFGVYAVLENGFITFNGGGDEQAGGTVMLKVTICNPNTPGHELTQLFTVQELH